jgi:hypothetical protein
MTRRTLCWLVLLVAGLTAFPTPAAAHRLDEYLQATRLDIGADRIVLEIDLTPGASIASQIVEQIDADRDGSLSSDERRRYAQAVVSSIIVSIDGRSMSVALIAAEFPASAPMAAGMGTIRVRAAVDRPAGSGRHRLLYRSGPLNASSVYLVNALIPSDARVQLGPPYRDLPQRELVLDFSVAPDAAVLRTAWVAIALTALGGLVARRCARSQINQDLDQLL